MQGRFVSEPALAIPDDDPAGALATLLVEGLATVEVDVLLDLVVSHPRPADLRVTLLNPAGTEVVVFAGAAPANGELFLSGHVVRGFSGDEGVNGAWRLKMVDSAAGQAGGLGLFGLTITSRWD
jgi:subtilisin-like proprotein convertase family protein